MGHERSVTAVLQRADARGDRCGASRHVCGQRHLRQLGRCAVGVAVHGWVRKKLIMFLYQRIYKILLHMQRSKCRLLISHIVFEKNEKT